MTHVLKVLIIICTIIGASHVSAQNIDIVTCVEIEKAVLGNPAFLHFCDTDGDKKNIETLIFEFESCPISMFDFRKPDTYLVDLDSIHVYDVTEVSEYVETKRYTKYCISGSTCKLSSGFSSKISFGRYAPVGQIIALIKGPRSKYPVEETEVDYRVYQYLKEIFGEQLPEQRKSIEVCYDDEYDVY